MATHVNQIDSDIAHILNVKKYLQHTMYKDVTEEDIRNGGAQRSTLVEIAVAKCGGFDHTPMNGYDNSDGSDTKSVTTRKHDLLGTCGALVKDTNNKKGLLRVQVYEKFSGEFYYFAIPHYAHSQAGNDLEIPFTDTGEPRRIPAGHRRTPNWWNYECSSFEEMCAVKNDGTAPKPISSALDALFEFS